MTRRVLASYTMHRDVLWGLSQQHGGGNITCLLTGPLTAEWVRGLEARLERELKATRVTLVAVTILEG